MTPNRDLDALVAEKVMGIELRAVTPVEVGEAVMAGMTSNRPFSTNGSVMSFDWGAADDFELTYQGSKYGYGGTSGNDGYGLWFWERREGQDWQPFIEAHVARWRRHVPGYSTDIAAAWAVAQRMRRDYSVEIQSRVDSDGWRVMLHPHSPNALSYVAEADTAPLAICRAALLAVGVTLPAS